MKTLEELITVHYKNDDLLNIARKMTTNEDQAQELLHNSIDRMLVKKHLYNNYNFLGYAKTVMCRILANQRRDETAHKYKNAVYTERSAAGRSVEDEIHYKMLFEDVAGLFDEKHKTVLYYKLNQFYSREVAKLINSEKDAIDGRFYRIKQRIRNKYRNEIYK